MRATPLTPDHHAAVLTTLSSAAVESVFLLGMLERRPIGSNTEEHWWGAWESPGALCALLFSSAGPTSAGPGLWVFSGEQQGAAPLSAALQSQRLPAMCIGPRALVDDVWAGLSTADPTLRANSRTLHCTAVSGNGGLDVRPARMSDLDWLRSVSVSMMREDLGLDPRAHDPTSHEARLRAGILAGRSWIGLEEGAPVFRLEVGTRSSGGIQVGGTWVPPQNRGQGIATRGMAAICTRLLEDNPRVTLHVREDNIAAIRCYRRIGFIRGAPLRLLVR